MRSTQYTSRAQRAARSTLLGIIGVGVVIPLMAIGQLRLGKVTKKTKESTDGK